MRIETLFASAPSFALPRLAPEIPVRLHDANQLALQAEVALLLNRAGLLHRRDVQRLFDSPYDYTQAALERWLRQGTGELRTIQPWLQMTLSPDESGRLEYVELVNEFSFCGVHYIGDGLEDLERRAPGLAAAAVDALDDQWACPFFLPGDAYDWVVRGEWMGEDDENEAIRLNCKTQKQREEMREAMITRKEVDDTYPGWLIASRSGTPTPLPTNEELARMADLPDDIGAVAAAVLTVRRTTQSYVDARRNAGVGLDDPDETDDDSMFFGYSHVLAWRRDDDITERVCDDLYNVARQNGVDRAVDRATVEASCPAHLARWARGQRLRHRALRALDQLLALILTRQ